MKIIPEKWRGAKMPKAIPAWFWLWAHWRDLGAPKGKRPASAPKVIPPWAWVRYLVHKGYKFADIGQPAPPKPTARTFGKAVLFHAGDEEGWLRAPYWYIRALSSDRNQDWTAKRRIDLLRNAQVQWVASWCDCRPGEGTDARVAIFDARVHGLVGWYGQAESAAEFDHALERGRENGLMPLAIIGNITVLRPDQLELVRNRDVTFIVEAYYNVWPWFKADYRGAQDGVAGEAVAMYASSTEGAKRVPLQVMRADGRYTPGRDSIYTPGSMPEDVASA